MAPPSERTSDFARVRPRASLALGVLAAVLGLHAAHALTGFGSHVVDRAINDWVYDAFMVTCALVCIARGVLVRAERTAWLILGFGIASWAVGEIYWSLFFADDSSPPAPSVADGFYLALYPALYVAIVLLGRSRMRSFRQSMWLDGAIGGLAVASVTAALIFEPVLHSTGGGAASVATNLAYPVADLLLLGLLMGVLALTGWRPARALGLMAVALACNGVADGVYLYQVAKSTYVDGSILDTVWLLSVFLLATAAWQPVPPRRSADDVTSWRLLAAPAVSALVAIGVLAYGNRAHIGTLALGLAVGALLLVVVRAGASVRENLQLLVATRVDALTDALTGLHNRRALLEDLSAALAVARDRPSLLVIFDLNGFKNYNDTFGHPAGDALLQRLGHRLAAHVAGRGLAYRLGGDEFCILMRLPDEDPQVIAAYASAALLEEGDGFTIGACFGAAVITPDMADVGEPLRIADQRLYASKRSAPELAALGAGVARLAHMVGERLGLAGVDLEDLRRAAELHDIGKAAIPQEILAKRGPLDASERAFVEQHSAIGERILAAAPALRPVSRIVRAAHERYDGAGYPDGLAGEQIPLAARIIAACDAYDALLAGRPYHPSVPAADAIAELRRCAGAQFDSDVVEALVDVVESPSGPSTPAGASRQTR
jgi:two-component system cell cycle response regulator